MISFSTHKPSTPYMQIILVYLLECRCVNHTPDTVNESELLGKGILKIIYLLNI